MAELSGGEMVIQSLIDEGVEYVFGYPGGAVLHIYDALFKMSDLLEHVLVRHEQAATHAADGLCSGDWKNRGSAGDLWARCDQCDHGNCHRLYGLDSVDRYLRAGDPGQDWR